MAALIPPMASGDVDRGTGGLPARAATLVVTLAGVLALLLAFASVRWPLAQDLPILFYASFLINELGLVPYRDVFDMNAPGAHAVYAMLTSVGGYSARAARAVDLACLAGVSVCTWRGMRWAGGHARWAAVTLFALVYLASGSAMSLQREFLLLLPTAAALVVVLEARLPAWTRAVVCGSLLGLATTIKPQAFIAWPVFVGYLLHERQPPGDAASSRFLVVAGSAAGALVPLAVVGAWLWRAGSLAPFTEMATTYWPLYTSLSGAPPYRTLSGLDRLRELAAGTAGLVTWPKVAWTAAALGGLAIALRGGPRDAEVARRARLVGALVVVFGLYPIVAGKFWHYHWLPFGYAAALASALAVAGDGPGRLRSRLGAGVLLVFCLGLPLPRLGPDAYAARRFAQAHEIAGRLARDLRPGETVQPLDWTGVALHAMLLARAPLATAFLEDVHFYHHVSHPYVRSLRAQFIDQVQRHPPRFVIEVAQPGWVSGGEISREFPMLRAWLETSYRPALERPGFRLYERLDDAAGSGRGPAGPATTSR